MQDARLQKAYKPIFHKENMEPLYETHFFYPKDVGQGDKDQ